MSLRAKATALVEPFKQKNPGGYWVADGGGWSSRMLRLIQRFRKALCARSAG